MSKKIVLMAVIACCLGALVYITLSKGPESLPPPLPMGTPGTGGSPGHPAGDGGVKEAVAAPDFALENLEGGQVTLAGLKGKVVVMNFWSSSCGPCIMEMPALERLAQLMKGKPFELITITSDPKPMVSRAAKQLNMSLPVLLDADGKVAIAYGVYFTPETYIIAPDGAVDNHIMGAANWADQSVVDYMNNLIQTAAAAGG